MFKAKFKTAYLQREIPVEVAVTAGTISTSSPKKKVALFKLVNKDDVTAYTVS